MRLEEKREISIRYISINSPSMLTAPNLITSNNDRIKCITFNILFVVGHIITVNISIYKLLSILSFYLEVCICFFGFLIYIIKPIAPVFYNS